MKALEYGQTENIQKHQTELDSFMLDYAALGSGPVPGIVTLCGDGDLCMMDFDDIMGVCFWDHPLVSCDDGNVCTIDSCNPVLGCANDPVDCDDGNVCTINSCDPDSGCANDPVDCDDGDACTIDSCDQVSGCDNTIPVDCDDGNLCTIDTCEPLVAGCTYTA